MRLITVWRRRCERGKALVGKVERIMDEYYKLNDGEVDQILHDIADDVLKSEKFYDEAKVDNWIEQIINRCLVELKKMEKPHKFIVTCKINQSDGSALFTHTSNFMDQEKDQIIYIKWKNPVMHCIITVLALWVYWMPAPSLFFEYLFIGGFVFFLLFNEKSVVKSQFTNER